MGVWGPTIKIISKHGDMRGKKSSFKMAFSGDVEALKSYMHVQRCREATFDSFLH